MINLVLSLILLSSVDDGTRFLSVKNITHEADRQKCVKVSSFILNSLSNQKKMGKVKLVGDKIEFNLKDFGIDAKVYDSLQHPYKNMRADWFIANVVLAPNYYNLLNIDDFKAFKKLINYDEANIDELKQRKSGIIGTSGVTGHNRMVIRTDYDDGVVWETRDINTSIGEADFLRNLLAKKYDSREVIARLPNGLLAYYVLDKNDKRLNKVDTDIVHIKVIVAKNCIMCHANGIVDLEDDASNPRKNKWELDSMFTQDMMVKKDQEHFAKILLGVNGLTPRNNMRYFKEIIDNYYKPITKEVAADELGLSIKDFEKLYTNSKNDVLLKFKNGLIVKREEWEKYFLLEQ